ncbi:MAG: TonB-dependent receptor [Sphingobacteriales bacterium]|nr:TonB-dependent receptor [Sphingobacteriales bacterium]
MKLKLYPTKLLSTLVLLFIVNNVLLAQNHKRFSLSGFILQNQKPLEGITISIKNHYQTAVSDNNGKFTFNHLKEGNYTLIVKLIGYPVSEKNINLNQDIENFNFEFSSTSKQLNEVKVIAQRSLNEQVTTASKSNVKAFDLPQSTTVINHQLIEDQQVNKLSDVIQNVNGVALGTTRGATSESFYSRGYSLGSKSILKNGSSVSSSVIQEASTLESVEVLKGSAAMLYGNVGTGAVVNMITKRPKYQFGGEVNFRSGSYNFYKPIVDLYGPISKTLAFRVVSTYENAASFRNSVYSNKTYVNPSLLYQLGKKTSVLFQADYLNYSFNPDFGIGTLGGKIPTSINRNAFFNTPWAFNKIIQKTSSLNFNGQLSKNWNWNAIAAFQNYERNYFSTERIQAQTNGDWARKLTRANTTENHYSSQVNFTGILNTGKIKHQILAGADADYYQNLSDAYKSFATYDTINVLDPNKYVARTDMPEAIALSQTNSPTYLYGIYAQDLISISQKTKFLLGLRYSFQRIGANKILDYQTQIVSKNNSSTQNNGVISPRFGLVYQPEKNISLFASYANSFEFNSGTDIYLNNLKPSIIDQFELGVKKDWFDNKFSSNVTLYKIINNNLAQQAEFAADGSLNTNSRIKEFAGQTTSDGLEIDLSGNIYHELQFMAGYSYTFMRYTKTPGTNGSYIEGEQLVRNVPHTANFTLFYTFNHAKIKGLKLGASAFYTGNRYAGWNNRVGQSQTESRIIPVKGYTTFDFSAGYTFGKLSLLAKISNLTDVLNYTVHENYSVNPIAPRQLMTTISYKF